MVGRRLKIYHLTSVILVWRNLSKQQIEEIKQERYETNTRVCCIDRAVIPDCAVGADMPCLSFSGGKKVY
jgi:hypothetical protein